MARTWPGFLGVASLPGVLEVASQARSPGGGQDFARCCLSQCDWASLASEASQQNSQVGWGQSQGIVASGLLDFGTLLAIGVGLLN